MRRRRSMRLRFLTHRVGRRRACPAHVNKGRIEPSARAVSPTQCEAGQASSRRG
jgi:hypothetical protein